MFSHEELQEQISQIFATVKSQGYKLEDVIPEEMQDHFQDMTALKEAGQYIKEAEVREKELRAENSNLSTKLRAKQAEVDDQPEEFKALKVDLQQAQRSIDYYKAIASDSQERAERYQHKLANAANQQTTAEEYAQKIQRLQTYLEHQQAINASLSQESRAVSDHCDKLIEEKDFKIATISAYADKLEKEKFQLKKDKVQLKEDFEKEKLELQAAKMDSEQVFAACESLIETLEQETHTVTNVVNRKSVYNDLFYSTIVSQIMPLNRFYDHTFSALSIYHAIFQSLLDPNSRITSQPKSLDFILDAAFDDLSAFQDVSNMVKGDGLAQEKVRLQVDDMARNAGRIYNCLDSIKDDVTGLLGLLRNEPDAPIALKGDFGSYLQVLPSPNPSILSFSSFANVVRSASRTRCASLSGDGVD